MSNLLHLLTETLKQIGVVFARAFLDSRRMALPFHYVARVVRVRV